MKKILIAIVSITFLSGCFIFKKKDKYGCPTDGRNVGAEKLASGDPKALKASNKAKYKGGRKSY
jgi:Prokaryotic membrane lipoprotein lipid attachment site